MRPTRSSLVAFVVLAAGCSSDTTSSSGTGGSPETGGAGSQGGTTGSGGTASGGQSASAGSTATGGRTSSGGTSALGGTSASGGQSTSGGTTPTGGLSGTSGATTSTGGLTGSGGTSPSGGAPPGGGTTTSGGRTATGGTSPRGGSGGVGGTTASGGAAPGGGSGGATTSSGGSGGASGGRSATGGSTTVDPNAPTTFDNPIIKYDAPDPTAGPGDNIFTADGAAMVWNDKVYLYVDKDAAAVGASGYVLTDWLLYESSDMVHWESKGSIATCKSISWCVAGSDGGLAAFQVIERDAPDGTPKFYLYGPVNNGQGIAIVVMVADSPEGPFKDARGIPLVTAADTANMGATHSWRNLDPTAFVDDDGQAYLAWGNKIFFTVKLEDDMIHLKGETYTTDASGKMQNRDISAVKITAHPKASSGDWSDYEEAPWLSKHGGLYYLTYAAGFPETINYATSTSPEGPWQFRGVVISRESKDASTIHQTLFDFRGASYMGYHSAELPTGSDYRRSQCMDRVYYNADGTLKKLVRTHK
jgi:hypothetical protein